MAMSDRPPLGALLDALSPYLDGLWLRVDRVEISVSLPTGRRTVRFGRIVAGPDECAIEILRDTAIETVEWLNAQPEVKRKLGLDWCESVHVGEAR